MQIRLFLLCIKVAVRLIAYACTIQPNTPLLKVRNATQAVNTALSYLRKQKTQNAPDADIKWQEQTLYAPGNPDFAITSRLFTADDWQIEVSQGVAPLNSTVYQVTVFNAELHWYWKGSVKADGVVTEVNAFKLLSEKENKKMAAEFLSKSKVPPPMPGGYGH